MKFVFAICLLFFFGINDFAQKNCYWENSFTTCNDTEVDSFMTIYCPSVHFVTDSTQYVIMAPRCATSEFSITFYNRWGEVMFETDKRGRYWNAKEAETGVYIYSVTATYLDGETHAHKGHFTILR